MCFKKKCNICVRKDSLNDWIEKCINADIIETKTFIERVVYGRAIVDVEKDEEAIDKIMKTLAKAEKI